jgi:hypothetical protein
MPRIMVDLNALLTPSMPNMTSPLPTSIVPMILRNDLSRMSGDEVDLLSILEVEFPLEIPMMFGLRFYILCCTSPLPAKFFLDHPQNICFLLEI